MHIASADRPVTYYDLETVISVGYRIKSPQGVAFRRWATARLKDYRLKGYALNQQRLQQNAAELEQALRLIQKTAASPELTVDSGRGLVDIVSRYPHTFLWLQQYDAGLLQEPSGENGGVLPNVQEARTALHIVKHLKNRNGVASPCRTTCTVCGDAPCYAFLSIQLYLQTTTHRARRGDRTLRPRAGRRFRRPAWQSRTKHFRRSCLSHHRKQSGAPAL